MAEKSALGKGFDGLGLNSLFDSNSQKPQKDDVYQELSLEFLTPCLSQPRKYFNEEQLKELAASIQEKGIVQPLVVRPIEEGKYEIVAGERRYRAARILNLEKVPVVVRNYTENEAMTIALIENIQREDLNPIEEAEAYALLKDKYSLSQEALAKSLGKNRSTLANSLRLLNLPKSMRELIFQKKLSAAHGRTLLALHNEDLQAALAERILKYNLSVRDAENLAEYANAYQALPKELSLTSLTKEEELGQDISTTETTELNVQEPKEIEEPKARRRLVAKSEFLSQLQKMLRKEVHRGTKISGSLENGKLILPFSGQHELEHLLHLLSFEHNLQNEQIPKEVFEDLAESAPKAEPEALSDIEEAEEKLVLAQSEEISVIIEAQEFEENFQEEQELSVAVNTAEENESSFDNIDDALLDKAEEKDENLADLEEFGELSEFGELDGPEELEEPDELEELSLDDLDDEDDFEDDDEDEDDDFDSELYEESFAKAELDSAFSEDKLSGLDFDEDISEILDNIEKKSEEGF